ncbi:hypothetical protein [Shewanella sp. UCD-KL21]|uniref:hypothetical protein n=1 Tax=Shewanella sp. UCD-KL21 TaxID=1917164 RepID=UPI0009714C8D|nr:hypothetical protein [Shewanella sp. UCD-KL21]
MDDLLALRLWQALSLLAQHQEGTIQALKKDWIDYVSLILVPIISLAFYIVGLSQAKKQFKSQLAQIESHRIETKIQEMRFAKKQTIEQLDKTLLSNIWALEASTNSPRNIDSGDTLEKLDNVHYASSLIDRAEIMNPLNTIGDDNQFFDADTKLGELIISLNPLLETDCSKPDRNNIKRHCEAIYEARKNFVHEIDKTINNLNRTNKYEAE